MVSVCLPSDALLQHLPSYLGFSYLGHGVSLHGCSSKAQPMLLTLDECIHKMKIMASDPITSWQTDGETVETVKDFIFLGSKITVDSDWEDQPYVQGLVAARAQEGQEELSHIEGQEGRW